MPQVWEQYWNGLERDNFGFSMPYFYASDFVMFFENSTTSNIIKTISMLLNFIDNNISESIAYDLTTETKHNECKDLALHSKTSRQNGLTLECNPTYNIDDFVDSKLQHICECNLESKHKATEYLQKTKKQATIKSYNQDSKNYQYFCNKETSEITESSAQNSPIKPPKAPHIIDVKKDSVYNKTKGYVNQISKEILLYKYHDTIAKITQNKSKLDCISHIEKEINTLPDTIQIPLGKCHGDLTFSNILFTDKKIILIDFLDNFIETPLQDIVKLRQDTKHLWSLRLYKRKHDRTKIKIILSYLDNIIDKHFSKYEFYRKYYSIFQKINLLRILPYAKNEDTFQYVINEIIKLNKKDKICQKY